MSDKGDGNIGVRCTICRSNVVTKHGTTPLNKQRYLCNSCGRTFVLDNSKYVSPFIEEVTMAMLKEGIPVNTIRKVLAGKVSKDWIYKKRREYFSKNQRNNFRR